MQGCAKRFEGGRMCGMGHIVSPGKGVGLAV